MRFFPCLAHLGLALFLLLTGARTGICWDKSIRIKTVAGERCVFLNDTDLERIIGVVPDDSSQVASVEKTPDGSQIFVNYYSQSVQKMYFISLQNGAVTRTVNSTASEVHLGPQDSYVAWAWKHGSEEGLKFSNGEFWDNWGQPIEWVDIVFDPTGRYFSYESAAGVDIYSTADPNGKSLFRFKGYSVEKLFVRHGVLYAVGMKDNAACVFGLVMISLKDWKIIRTITLKDPMLDQPFDLNANGDKLICGLRVVMWPSMEHFYVLDLNTLKKTSVPMFYPDVQYAYFLPKGMHDRSTK